MGLFRSNIDLLGKRFELPASEIFLFFCRSMKRFAFDKYEVEIINDPDYDANNSGDNVNTYEFIYAR
jgi:hypothetical protein